MPFPGVFTTKCFLLKIFFGFTSHVNSADCRHSAPVTAHVKPTFLSVQPIQICSEPCGIQVCGLGGQRESARCEGTKKQGGRILQDSCIDVLGRLETNCAV